MSQQNAAGGTPGIVLNADGDLAVLNGRLLLGDTLMQQAAIVLQLRQGELKEDPLLGPNLLRQLRGKAARTKIDRAVKIHLSRAGIDYETIKEKLTLIINGNENKQ